MTNLYDGQVKDLLQNGAKHNPEIKALSYAVLQEKRRILDQAAKTLLMAAMDLLDEKTLDYIAVELRTPAYKETYPIETKRTLIKGTLPFYAKFGTPSAVNWLMRSIFRDGSLEEWWQYDGEPHHFRVTIGTSDTITQENLNEFRKMIASVKRLSSWLDDIISEVAFDPATVYIGAVLHETRTKTTLPYLEPKFRGATFYVAPRLNHNLMTTRLPVLDSPVEPFYGSVRISGASHTWTQTKLPFMQDYDTQVTVTAEVKATGKTHSWMETEFKTQRRNLA